MSGHYYNEFDPKAAAWLRELMADGLIPHGEVDERSIRDVKADDVRQFHQRHWFAGIGGFARALKLAGWPENQPIDTGSCPCQPYSVAGARKGNTDERDLWPDFFRLIRELRPGTVCGEQVESAIGFGWLDRVCDNMEGEGYAVWTAVLGAYSLTAPHKRARLFWVARRVYGVANSEHAKRGDKLQVNGNAHGRNGLGGGGHIAVGLADSIGARLEGHSGDGDRGDESRREPQRAVGPASEGGEPCGVAHSRHGTGSTEQGNKLPQRDSGSGEPSAEPRRLGESDSPGQREGSATAKAAGHGRAAGADGSVGDAEANGRQTDAVATSGLHAKSGERGGEGGTDRMADPECSERRSQLRSNEHNGDNARRDEATGRIGACGKGGGFWSDYTVIAMRDGKSRRIPKQPQPVFQRVVDGIPEGVDASGAASGSALREPETGFPLCQKIEGRTMLLKGFGNSIVPEVAAVFIRAFMEATQGKK